jgi:hypothetical protein
MPDVVTYTCHPSTWEAETGGLQVQGQPEVSCDTVSKNNYFADLINVPH